MSSIDTLRAFFGWSTIVSVGIYLVTVLSLLLFRDKALRINARLFGMTEKEVALTGFQYVGNIKLATTMFLFGPYEGGHVLAQHVTTLWCKDDVLPNELHKKSQNLETQQAASANHCPTRGGITKLGN